MPARLPFTIFQGGMPRASYGDRHCISVVHNGQQTAFDFTSRVIDFTVLIEVDPVAGRRAGVGVEDGSPPVNKEGGPAGDPSAAAPSPSAPPGAAPSPSLLAWGLSLLATPPTHPKALLVLQWLTWDLAQRGPDLHYWL